MIEWTPIEKGLPELPGFYWVTVDIEGKLRTVDSYWDKVSGWRAEAVGDKVTAWMMHPKPYRPEDEKKSLRFSSVLNMDLHEIITMKDINHESP